MTQSDSVDKLKKELENLENNLSIKWGKGERCFRDDQETKLRMARAMIRFKSFRVIKGIQLSNEFEFIRPQKKSQEYSKCVLRKHWYPTAEELIRRYVKGKKHYVMWIK